MAKEKTLVEERPVRLDAHGHEIPDPRPMTIPAGFKRPETLAETVKRLVRSEQWAKAMEEAGEETFEEADDFEVGDDYDPSSPYEQFFDPVLNKDVTPAEWQQNPDRFKRDYTRALDEEFKKGDRAERIDALRRPIAWWRKRKSQMTEDVNKNKSGEGQSPSNALKIP